MSKLRKAKDYYDNMEEMEGGELYAFFWCVFILPFVLIHRIFIGIPNTGFGTSVFIGIARTIFMFWLFLYMIQEPSNSFFEGDTWCGHMKQTSLFFQSIFGTWGEGMYTFATILVFINMILQLFIAWGFNKNSAHEHYAYSSSSYSNYSNINRALEARDLEMDQLTYRDKAKAMASTGFLTKGSLSGDLSENEREALEALDMELSQKSFRGSLDHLRKLFKGD